MPDGGDLHVCASSPLKGCCRVIRVSEHGPHSCRTAAAYGRVVTTRALIAAGVSLTTFVAGLSVVPSSAPAAASAPSCTATQLRLRPTLYGEAGGQFMQTFTLTNAGANACRLAGWPTLRGVVASGKSESAPSIRVVQGNPAAKPFRTVVLQPGSVAAFDIFGADYDA